MSTSNDTAAIATAEAGWQLLREDRQGDAEALFRRALELAPGLVQARRGLAVLLVRARRHDEALPLWECEVQAGPEGIEWLQRTVNHAMRSPSLELAGEYAAIVARLRWGAGLGGAPPVSRSPSLPISAPKLRHDIEQFQYLQSRGILGDTLTGVIADYDQIAETIERRDPDGRRSLDSDEYRRLSYAYNRLLYVRPTPRVEESLSGSWDPTRVEQQYLDQRPGIVVIDDFLSDRALAEVRAFCLESTVWSGNRYAYGRLGAFFQDGFNCPLLLQIAEELRTRLPRMIGARYPLRQLWGFKNGARLPADSTTHADFAAVNVNFWITPDEANLDPGGGGLVVYDVDAPMHWDFDTYNGNSEAIRGFLQRQRSVAVRIPYRCNRAVIFNSDLFHGTDGLNFRPGYEHRRVNVTMLYGEREHEVHHRNLARPDPFSDPYHTRSAWRSAAFSRARSL